MPESLITEVAMPMLAATDVLVPAATSKPFPSASVEDRTGVRLQKRDGRLLGPLDSAPVRSRECSGNLGEARLVLEADFGNAEMQVAPRAFQEALYNVPLVLKRIRTFDPQY